jgi:hypothetical protein
VQQHYIFSSLIKLLPFRIVLTETHFYMKKNQMLYTVFLSFTCLALLGSCKKDTTSEEAASDDKTYAMDNARLEQTFNDVQNIADEAATTGTLSNFKTTGGAVILNGCATVTRDTISIPHTVTIDFGSTNCLGNDGRYRRGQIILSYTGGYRDSGHVHTITFNNYYVNDNHVTGTKTITNMGHNPAGHMYFTVSVNGAVILANSQDTLSWASTRMRTWIAGENTMMRLDDIYEVTGSGTVTRPNNHSFSVNITSPLKVALNCHWISQGVVQIIPIVPTQVLARTVDYGNGTCDNQATLTVGNNSYNITLP